MSNLGGGGYHWQDESRAADWDDMQRRVKSERAKGFETMLGFLPQDTNQALKILDLGAGDGSVAEIILERYPNATAALIDFSAPMIAKGTERLRKYGGRWHYVYWDMNEGVWPTTAGGPFDAVVSSAAIHHLTNDRKLWVAAEVVARIAPGGVFANYDLFRDPEAIFAEDDIHGRTCATLDEAKTFLVESGYMDIYVGHRLEIPDQKGELALLAGRRHPIT